MRALSTVEILALPQTESKKTEKDKYPTWPFTDHENKLFRFDSFSNVPSSKVNDTV